MDPWIFFNTLVILQYCFIYFLPGIVPVLATGSSFSWLLYFFEISSSLGGFINLFALFICLFKYFLTFRHYNILQAHSVYFLPYI